MGLRRGREVLLGPGLLGKEPGGCGVSRSWARSSEVLGKELGRLRRSASPVLLLAQGELDLAGDALGEEILMFFEFQTDLLEGA